MLHIVLCRNFGIATKHYAACLKQLQDWQAQHQGSDCQSISLPHFSSGLVISTSVAQAKLDSLRSHQVRFMSWLMGQYHNVIRVCEVTGRPLPFHVA